MRFMYLLVLNLLSAASNTETDNKVDLELFPDQTKNIQSNDQSQNSDSNRALSFRNEPYTTPVLCAICNGLSVCNILNGLLVQEVYYPQGGNVGGEGTCRIIDERGVRLSNGDKTFGPDSTFRDTPTCRNIVMQYLCLFWGSDNPMYTNHCIFQEDVSAPNPALHRIAPRAPCKSFCVQIASTCANDPDAFYIQCEDILCPPTQDTCTPDPVLAGQSLSANLGCASPFYLDPYAPKNSAARIRSSIITISMILLMVALLSRG
mmetsp:Transcript_13065/g.12660  ORF Transcript_13065/g.12660 Transcript_13065/m.12660 type:complete len:262 (-) Transcript_13065:1056-1841(-)